MNSKQDRAWKFAYFALGLAAPVAAVFLWKRCEQPKRRRDEIDRAHDITVEDSFPASDPPSAW
jgi:hypothetical protein